MPGCPGWPQLNPADTRPTSTHLPSFCLTIKGPPLSPLQESLPPKEYPAHNISGYKTTFIPLFLCNISHSLFSISGTSTTCNTLGLFCSLGTRNAKGPSFSSGIIAPHPAA